MRESFLIAASRIEAADLSFFLFFQTSSTGPKAAVYLAPLPELWSAIRPARLFVIPVYKEPLAHRTTYTVQNLFEEEAGMVVGAGGLGACRYLLKLAPGHGFEP